MALRDNQAVTGRYWKAIVNPDGVFIFLNDTVGLKRAELAGHLAASIKRVPIMPIDKASSASMPLFFAY